MEPTTNDQEQRVLVALGLSSGPLPKVQAEWLLRYHRHLSANLELPFDAEYAENISGHQQRISSVKVIALVPPNARLASEENGLLCRVRRDSQEIEVPLVDVELQETTSNSRLIEDYWYWIWNWRFDPQI